MPLEYPTHLEGPHFDKAADRDKYHQELERIRWQYECEYERRIRKDKERKRRERIAEFKRLRERFTINAEA